MDGESEQVAALRAHVAALEAELNAHRNDSARLRAVLDAVPSIVMHLDDELRVLDISRLVTGFSRESVVGSPFLEYVPMPERPEVERRLRSVLETGKPTTYTTVGPGPGETPSMYESYVASLRGDDGRTELIVVAIDVTQQRQRDDALRERELMLSVACDATGIGLWIWDLQTNRVTWNVGMHTLTGVDHPIALEAYRDRLVHPDDRAVVRDVGVVFATQDTFQSAPHRIIRPDGQMRWVVTSGRVHRNTEGTIDSVIGATIDVTSHRASESNRTHGERLAAVGRLAAGVAHNFNNHLSTMLPVLEMLREHQTIGRDDLIDDAIHAGRRSADLVRQLLAFARRRDAGTLVAERFEPVVERATALCRSLIDRTIELSYVSHAKDVYVDCDSGAIEQAVVNLVVNARDAIADTGRGTGHIRVSLELESADPPGPREFAVLRIADDGAGMDSETRDRIFEPFFTTKDAGRGTGLGLSITYATLESHHASVRCESTPTVGTTFELRFPTTRAPGHEPAAEPKPDSLRARPMRILLCDDDDGVREVVSTWLDHMGHEVSTASELEEAIASLRRGPGRDLVLLDRSLLGNDAKEPIDRIRAASPKAFVVFFSGDEVPDEELVLVDHVLVKPPSAQTMDAMLEALFGS